MSAGDDVASTEPPTRWGRGPGLARAMPFSATIASAQKQNAGEDGPESEFSEAAGPVVHLGTKPGSDHIACTSGSSLLGSPSPGAAEGRYGSSCMGSFFSLLSCSVHSSRQAKSKVQCILTVCSLPLRYFLRLDCVWGKSVLRLGHKSASGLYLFVHSIDYIPCRCESVLLLRAGRVFRRY